MGVQQNSNINWELICRNMVKGNLIPIVGNEMYTCQVNNEPADAEFWFAQQLQKEFGANNPAARTLTATVEFLVNEQNVKIKQIRTFLQTLSTQGLTFPLLEDFSAIDQILFYINTTPYGDILSRIISRIRGVETGQDEFTIDEPFEGCDIALLESPFVLNILGSLERSLKPSLLEEEMLECVNSFIEKKQNAPLTKMLGELGSKTLIFLGCSEPSWMMRFLYRNLSNGRLSSWGDRGADIVIVNDKCPERDVLFEFLGKNNAITYEGNTSDFVNELNTHWADYIKRNPPKPKEIFISYSHKDLDQARLLVKSLSTLNNVKIWFDEHNLQSGNNYQIGITQGIVSSDLFIALISKNSVDSGDEALVTVKGEWRQACYTNDLRKLKNGGKDLNYLMPVAIDDVDKGNALIKDFFSKLSIADVPGGNASETFISQVKQQLNII